MIGRITGILLGIEHQTALVDVGASAMKLNAQSVRCVNSQRLGNKSRCKHTLSFARTRNSYMGF